MPSRGEEPEAPRSAGLPTPPAVEHQVARVAAVVVERDRRKLQRGTVVALKAWVVDRMAKNGVFKREEVANVRVVSPVDRDHQLEVATLKGDVLGLVNVDWLDLDYDVHRRAVAGGRG